MEKIVTEIKKCNKQMNDVEKNEIRRYNPVLPELYYQTSFKYLKVMISKDNLI